MADDGQRVDPRYDPRFQRGYEADAVRAAEPVPPSRDAEPIDVAVGTGDADDTPPIRNVPELLLLVFGVAAIVGGLLLYTAWSPFVWGGFRASSDVAGEVIRHLVTALPTPLIVAGIASVLAWLMVRALAPRPPREVVDE